MKLDIVNGQNEKVGALELNEDVFGGRVKTDLIWESVVHQNASDRRGTSSLAIKLARWISTVRGLMPRS